MENLKGHETQQNIPYHPVSRETEYYVKHALVPQVGGSLLQGIPRYMDSCGKFFFFKDILLLGLAFLEYQFLSG